MQRYLPSICLSHRTALAVSLQLASSGPLVLCPASSAVLDFVGIRNTLELWACKWVPRDSCLAVLNTPLGLFWTEAPLGWLWEPSGWSQGMLLKWLWAQALREFLGSLGSPCEGLQAKTIFTNSRSTAIAAVTSSWHCSEVLYNFFLKMPRTLFF